MAKKNVGNLIGSWAFLIGVILAVILGVFGTMTNTWLIALVIIGLLVGLLNITGKETNAFLMSGIVLIIASAFGQSVIDNITIASNILSALLAIFVPSTIIVAIKNAFVLARD